MRNAKATRAGCLALLLPPILLQPTSGKATEYSLGYGVESASTYNDNLGLDAQDQDAAYGTKLKVPLTLRASGSRLQTTLDSDFIFARYDDSGYDSDDQRLNALTNYSFERGSVGASAGINRTSTRDTEFLDTGDIGGVATRVEVLKYSVNSKLLLSELSTLDLTAGYQETEYDSTRYIDNENISGSATWSYRVSQQTAMVMRANAGQFENDARFGVKSVSTGLQLGFNSTLSESLSLTLLGGGVYVDSEQQNNLAANNEQRDNGDTGYLVNGALNYKLERAKIAATVVRSLYPSGNGYLSESSLATLNFAYKLGEHTSTGLEFRAGSVSSLNNRFSNDRDYAAVRFKLGQQVARDWKVSGSVTYRYQTQSNSDDDIHSTSVGFSIVYQPSQKIWSR